MRGPVTILIPSDRHRLEDMELWAEMEEADLVWGARPALESKAQQAIRWIVRFVRKGRCYAGVSWGKDSVVTAHLCWRAISQLGELIPLVWIKVEPIANPECVAVESDFLERHYCEYRRIVIACPRDLLGCHATGTLEAGFTEAVRWAGGARHISGVRGEESGGRALRMRKWGPETARTLAPIGFWSSADVFGYLAHNGLPVHPAYAMLGGGRWDRKHLRVASLGGRRGDQFGRAEWEREYYGDVLRRLTARSL